MLEPNTVYRQMQIPHPIGKLGYLEDQAAEQKTALLFELEPVSSIDFPLGPPYHQLTPVVFMTRESQDV
jgi:hypothetical protein